jgi:hypothetical protein
MAKALRYPTRPLASDIQGEEPGKFPFDAFEMDYSTDPPTINLRSTWQLNVTNPITGIYGWDTGRQITLTGDVSGVNTPLLDGTTNVTIATTVANDSHTHDTRYYTETELNAGQLDTRYYTETELASTSLGEGASLIGIHDSAANYSATTVEGALQEAVDYTFTTRDEMAAQLGYDTYSNMVLEVASNGSIITSGGYLRANLIEADAIVSDMIAAGAIGTEQLDAGSVTAEKIVAGALAFPTRGLVSHYSLDDTSESTTVIDTSGNGNHGTKSGFGPATHFKFDGDLTDEQGNSTASVVTGTAAYATGKTGQAVSGARIDYTNPQSGSAGTVAFWVKLTAGGDADSLLNTANGTSDNIFIRTDDVLSGSAVNYDFFIRDQTAGAYYQTAQPTGSDIKLNEWQHLAMTWDDGTVECYVDGVNVATLNATTGGWAPTGNQGIINLNYADTGASIDDFREYDYALSSDEVSALYTRPSAPAEAVDGVAGRALQFNGADQYVSLPSGAYSVVDGSAAFSISTWVKLDTLTPAEAVGRVFEIESTNLAVRVFYADSITEWAFSMNDIAAGGSNSQIVTTGDSATTDWQHIVATFSGSTMSLYLDGSLVNTTTYNRTTSTPTSGLIGADNTGGGSAFDGLIDEVRIYNRALTATEVKLLYQFPGGVGAGVVNGEWLDDFSIITDKLAAGAITAGKIDVSSLSAITANLGTITAGTMQSDDWGASAGMEIDLDNGRIRMGGSSSPAVDLDAGLSNYELNGTVSSTSGNYNVTVEDGSVLLNYGGAVHGEITPDTVGSNTGVWIAGKGGYGTSGATLSLLNNGSSDFAELRGPAASLTMNSTRADFVGAVRTSSTLQALGVLYANSNLDVTGYILPRSGVNGSQALSGTAYTPSRGVYNMYLLDQATNVPSYTMTDAGRTIMTNKALNGTNTTDGYLGMVFVNGTSFTVTETAGTGILYYRRF